MIKIAFTLLKSSIHVNILTSTRIAKLETIMISQFLSFSYLYSPWNIKSLESAELKESLILCLIILHWKAPAYAKLSLSSIGMVIG